MQDYELLALNALEAYQSRGDELLHLLGSGDKEAAIVMMRKRNAAFYNFRALDHIALQNGKDLRHRVEVERLWTAIQTTDEQIRQLLQKERDQANKQIVHLQKTRKNLQRYYSKRTERPRFSSSI